MKLLKLVGTCLVAMLVFTALAASSAPRRKACA